MRPGSTSGPEPLDLLGIGVGPMNLSLAALADGAEDLRCAFLERAPRFAWHPGLLIEGATLQVPFLADLVSLVDPTSPWSFLNYLRVRGRLFPFYFAERSHVPRREYDDYCRWVAESLPSCRFGQEIERVEWDAEAGAFAVIARDVATGATARHLARRVALGIGTEPAVPGALAPLLDDPRVLHAADYLSARDDLIAADDVTVVGSGQSGAEVLLDLLRAPRRPGARLRWLTRSRAFAPMEYSKLGLEHFTPDYADYFHALDEPVRDRLVPEQWQLYKGISADTIAEIHQALYERGIGGGWPEDVELRPGVAVTRAEAPASLDAPLRLELHEAHEGARRELATHRLVLATGYRPREPRCLDGLGADLRRDAQGRLCVDRDHRARLADDVDGRLYAVNAELHSHGVGAPDLGLGAYRSARILNDVAGREVHALPDRTAFTSFGLAA